MIKVGIVGSYGSKKSYITRVFAEMDIPVFSSNVISSCFIDHNDFFRTKLFKSFEDFKEADGPLNSELFYEFIFRKVSRIKKFQNLIQPFIKECFDKWAVAQHSDIIIIEDDTLLDNDIYGDIDYNIGIISNMSLREGRLQQNFNLSQKETTALINSGLSNVDFISNCDFIIENNSALSFTQTISVYNELKQKLLT